MDEAFFNKEVEAALAALKEGKVILYPTDTIWGLGCNALDEKAVKRIYRIKEREDQKSMIILLAEERDILPYVAAPHPAVFDLLEASDRPTTVIYENALGLPEALVNADGSIAIRIVKDPFCRHLVRRLRAPLVSTSANISGGPSPGNFGEINPEIIERVDHVVKWRQEEREKGKASRIVKLDPNGDVSVIRE